MPSEPISPVMTKHDRMPQDNASAARGIIGTQLSEALARLPEGLLLLDREWRLVYANEQAQKISRLQPEHMNSGSHWELFPATAGTEVERRYRRVMEERVEEEFEFYYAPFRIWIKLRVYPAGDGIAVRYADMTELHEAEAERDAALERMQQMFAATTDAVLALNPEWTITFLNESARRLTAPSGEVLGRNLWNAFPKQVYEGSETVKLYYRAMVDRQPGSLDTFYPEPLNVWVHVEARPFEGGIVLFVRDVTQQHRDEEALRISEEKYRALAERLEEERAETER